MSSHGWSAGYRLGGTQNQEEMMENFIEHVKAFGIVAGILVAMGLGIAWASRRRQ